MITFADEIRNKMLGERKSKTLLGSISNVDGIRVRFVWNGVKAGISGDQAKQLFFAGSELQLKFQVKMFKKSFFEVVATVETVELVGDGGVRIAAKFKKISDGDRDSLSRFAADMDELKRQLPGK